MAKDGDLHCKAERNIKYLVSRVTIKCNNTLNLNK